MNQLFHYHITAHLASLAGFSNEDARLLAHSSTMVDYAVLPLPLDAGPEGTYIMPCTHHYGFGGKGSSEEVWIPFHFFPDGKDEWKVHPHNAAVKELLVAALRSRNLYRIGIALHTYADTWAHQGFSGLREKGNLVDSSSPLPPIGHAQASRIPDITGLAWLDPRRPDEIQWNGTRFLEAAEYIYRYLCTFQGRSFSDWEAKSRSVRSLLEPYLEWDMAPVYQDHLGQVHDGIRSLGSNIRNLVGRLNRDNETDRPDVPVHRLEVRQVGLADKELVHQVKALSGLDDFDENAWLDEVAAEGSQFVQEKLRSGIGARILSLGQSAFRKNPDLFPFRIRTLPGFRESHLFQWAEAARLEQKTAWEILGNHGLRATDLARSMDV